MGGFTSKSARFDPERVRRLLAGKNVKVIGLGGIGSAVTEALAVYLASNRARATLWLVDGDSYEETNRSRLIFSGHENKALARSRELSESLSGALPIVPVPTYVTPRNVRRVVTQNDVVFLCVDNHATRRLVSNRCRRLREVLLISGGNDGIEQGREGTFGNVQIYRRMAGEDCTHPLTRFHPEIARPTDRRPDEQGCAELAATAAPQLLFTNRAVASAMLGAFYAWLGSRLDYDEIFLDIGRATMVPVRRRSGARLRNRAKAPAT